MKLSEEWKQRLLTEKLITSWVQEALMYKLVERWNAGVGDIISEDDEQEVELGDEPNTILLALRGKTFLITIKEEK